MADRAKQKAPTTGATQLTFHTLGNTPSTAARAVAAWRWCLGSHIDKRLNLPDYCHLCWNVDSYEKPWRPVGFTTPGLVA